MKNHNILAYICSRGRYDTSLSQAMLSLAMQTRVPDNFILYDDNPASERRDLRDIEIYQYIFQLFDIKGIKWSVVFGSAQGQHHGHQAVQKMASDLCFRLDDDCVCEADVLEKLEAKFLDDVGAVGCSILTPPLYPHKNSSSSINNLYAPNEQWSIIKDTHEVDTMHCSYMYRANIMDFDLRLSRVAFREESMHSYGIKIKGYKVLVTSGIIWHFRNKKSGGIRSAESEQNYKNDEFIFLDWLKMNTVYNDQKLIVLDCGLGDNLVFKKDILPQIKKKHENIVLAVCHPDLFPDEKTISIAEAQRITDIDKYNIYKMGVELNWDKSLKELFEKMYL